MGADIHSFYERKLGGKWVKQDEPIFPDYNDEKNASPFDWRNYGMFGFLADVRNYSQIPPLAEPRGLPDDSEYLNSIDDNWDSRIFGANTVKQELLDSEDHSFSYFTVAELLAFDYDDTFENMRVSVTHYTPGGGSITDGASTAEKGNGTIITYRDFLGSSYFKDLKILKNLGDPEDTRIVFWFDN